MKDIDEMIKTLSRAGYLVEKGFYEYEVFVRLDANVKDTNGGRRPRSELEL
jgi:hypothetical protein